jgi:MFS family permease
MKVLSQMGNVDHDAEKQAFEAGVARDFRWNFAVNVLDGTFFWFGINFATPSTILPLYVRHLTSSPLLIGLIATISGSGWSLPQLFTANHIERLPRKKPVVVNIGLFAERLPILVMAASTMLFATRAPSLALVLLFLTLAWHFVGAGLIAVAWQEMIARVIPVQYRGRLLGLANFGGTATGILGAGLAAVVLNRYPFPTSFALCFAIASVFIFLSWVCVALTREPPLHSEKPSISFRQFWQRLPQVLRQDPNFALYLLARVMTVFSRMGIGFLTVYAVDRWQLSDGQAGLYTAAILAGQAGSNLALGALADRRGHKLVLEISVLLGILAMLGAVLAPAPLWMYLVFASVGALSASDLLAAIGITMEFAAPEERPTYIGLANTVPGVFAVFTPMIGGWIAGSLGYPATFVTAAVFGLLAVTLLHWRVREPRKRVA